MGEARDRMKMGLAPRMMKPGEQIIEHIKAYRHLQITGVWPKGFIPEEVDSYNVGWHILIAGKMANEWIIRKLEEEK